MRILYAMETMYYVTQGLLRGLERQGHEVFNIPLEQYPRSAQGWHLERAIRTCRPHLMLTPGWSIDHFDLDQYHDTLRRTGLFHVYWATEDPTFHDEVSLQFVPHSDYVFTTTAECLPRYAALGKPASLLLFGCNPEIHRKVWPDPAYKHDVVLVANNYLNFSAKKSECRNRALRTVLLPLIEAGFDVRVYGVYWTDRRASVRIPKEFYGGYLSYRKSAVVYSSAKIVLGIHWDDTSQTQTSVRTFEIMGSGAFYLTYYTPAHEHLFENHKHLVWSRSPEETVELVKYYLLHDEERRRIAAAGQKLVYSQHSYDHRAQEFERALKPFLT
ncbi:MAG: glycosyltransferase [Betaproteobacteria bacterium]